MKWVNVIFSIYLVTLSCLPCADVETNNVSAETTKSACADDCGNSKDKHTDQCSPFCICNCCYAQVLTLTPTIVFSFGTIQTLISQGEILYKSHLASTFSGSIWQPPQLV